jgi:hypothetical protein
VPPKRLVSFHGNGSQFAAIFHDGMIADNRAEKFERSQEKKIETV